MLKNISSVISPDLLWLLASMGHGEDLVLVDRNFPAIQVAKQTSTGRLIELAGLNIPQATRAILSLMPLDHFVSQVAALASGGYTAITVTELDAMRSGARPFPDKPILLTFDDARAGERSRPP